jgi:purine nucleosidase
MQRPIWLDTDPGFDDLVTLLLAARSPELEVCGISVVAGNAPLNRTLHNTLTIAQAFEIAAPVYGGADRPLLRPANTAESVLGAGAFGTVGASLPTPTRQADTGNGVLRLLEMADKHAGNLTVVAIGPLTNIALAMRLEPRLAGQIKELVIMGGSSDRGNHTAAAEYNFYADPEAAAIVFSSGANIAMFGLNLTRQVLLTSEHIAVLRRSQIPHAQALADMAQHYLQIRPNQIMPLHDPVTVAYLLHPEWFVLEAARVEIECHGAHTAGMSVCEFRVPARGQPNARVAVQANGKQMLEWLLGVLS